MAVPVYSRNFVATSLPPGIRVGVAPAQNEVLVIRDIGSFSDAGVSANGARLYCEQEPEGFTWHYHEFPGAARGTDHWVGRQVFVPGQEAWFREGSGVQGLDIRVSGYIFQTAP